MPHTWRVCTSHTTCTPCAPLWLCFDQMPLQQCQLGCVGSSSGLVERTRHRAQWSSAPGNPGASLAAAPVCHRAPRWPNSCLWQHCHIPLAALSPWRIGDNQLVWQVNSSHEVVVLYSWWLWHHNCSVSSFNLADPFHSVPGDFFVRALTLVFGTPTLVSRNVPYAPTPRSWRWWKSAGLV